MSKIGAGKPMSQTVVLQQDATALLQQFTMYGNSTEGYIAFQNGPMDVTFTRTFWPTSYIVVAVVGFFLCLIGPLILLMHQSEVFTVSLSPGPQPGTTVVRVNGLVDKDMMTRLMLILGQGQFQANSVLATAQRDPMLSPDGHYRWDGTAWRSVDFGIPPHAQRSPDGNYWWDGQQWRTVASQSDSAHGGSSLPPPDARPAA